ncbi:hypothetical protein KKP89_02445 [Methanothermococcus sp. SCGC AD-155-N22]|nr:hypothetical protein [Methanothermococcus sp. SCGC AD-155-N22]
MIYNLDWLKEKGFFKKVIPLEDVEGALVDEKNMLAYVEVSSNEEVERIKRRLMSLKVKYIWFFFPSTGKVKVFRRIGEIKWFYYSPKMRKDYRKSREDKLKRFSPDNMNILFDIRDVVEKFYWELWEHRILMAKSIEELKEDRDKLIVVQRLIDRLIFFYFLAQLKLIKVRSEGMEWVLDRRNTREFFQWICDQLSEEELQEFLNRIFFDVLGKVNEEGFVSEEFEIGGERFSILSPCLNGGLFVEEEVEGISERDIRISGIKKLILDVLNNYNWIIGEELPEEEDVVGDLTPEIIGHIYEKFVVSLEQIGLGRIKLEDVHTVRRELRYGRKKIGAYYTPEEITNYISMNTIYPYIRDRLRERFKGDGETLLDNLFSKDSFSGEELEIVKYLYFEVLRKLKICDNACGSGSFLIAVGDILLRLYSRVLKILGENLSEDKDVKKVLEEMERSPTRNYYIVRQIIVNNLYGVDIMEGAVEIAKLRFWLWLISQVDPKRVEGKRIETLPNLDFNLMVGNSLIGFVDIEDVEFDFIRGQITLDSLFGDSKVEWLKDLAKKKREFKTLPSHEAVKLKESLNRELEKGREFLNEKFYSMLKRKGIKISKEEFLNLKPFHWGFEFYDVFDLEKPKEERGFDIIVGNPPYGNILSNVEKKIVKTVYPFKVALTEKGLKGSHNSAAIFIERSYSIMAFNGKFSFIVPNTIARKDEFQKLRWFILNYTYCYELADVGNPFKHSGVNLEMIIIFYERTQPPKDYKIRILSKRFEKPMYIEIPKSKFEKVGWFAFYYDDIFDYLLPKPKLGLYGKFFGAARPSKLKVKISTIGDIPVVKGNGIKRYYINKIYYIEKNKNVETYMKSLNYPVIILPEVSSSVQAVIINKLLPISGVEIWKPEKKDLNKKYLLIILNSTLLTYYYNTYIINRSELTTHLDSTYLERLPFIIQNNQQPFITLADYLLFLNATEDRRKKEKELINFIDRQIIDSLVYELYFKEKFYQDKLYPEPKEYLLELISRHLKPINYDLWAELYWKRELEGELNKEEENKIKELEEENLKTIKEAVKNIKKDRKISVLINKIKSHPWVKVIEGKN